MEKVLLYAEDLSKVAERSPFDEASFQTFQSIGRSMVDDMIEGSAYYEIAESFSNALSLFDDSCRLTSGLSMERIWNSLSQPTANHASLLVLRIGTEELSDRFDALSWRSKASLHELATLRSSIIEVFKMLEFSDANSKERLKVCGKLSKASPCTNISRMRILPWRILKSVSIRLGQQPPYLFSASLSKDYYSILNA